jgi:hypothetical protein
MVKYCETTTVTIRTHRLLPEALRGCPLCGRQFVQHSNGRWVWHPRATCPNSIVLAATVADMRSWNKYARRTDAGSYIQWLREKREVR